LEVTVLNRQRSHRVRPQELTAFLHRLALALPEAGADSLSMCLVSDRKMREYNRQFRAHNAATDVLSFPTDGRADPAGGRHLGDIVISVTTAALQARQARHSLEQELKLLALHGYLHLLGYDHRTDDGSMLRMQRRLIRRLLPRAKRGISR
jgi:probable rRNA maturation factor